MQWLSLPATCLQPLGFSRIYYSWKTITWKKRICRCWKKKNSEWNRKVGGFNSHQLCVCVWVCVNQIFIKGKLTSDIWHLTATKLRLEFFNNFYFSECFVKCVPFYPLNLFLVTNHFAIFIKSQGWEVRSTSHTLWLFSSEQLKWGWWLSRETQRRENKADSWLPGCLYSRGLGMTVLVVTDGWVSCLRMKTIVFP